MNMTRVCDIDTNYLLQALTESEWERWESKLELVPLPKGKVLFEAGVPIKHVYFPTTAIVSIMHIMENGATSKVAIVGNDGMVGIALLTGGESTPSRAVVLSAGEGYRLSAQAFKEEMSRAGTALKLLLCYTQTYVTQITMNAACNRHHSVDQQLCRWLLENLDRLQCDDLVATHELIASLLGVRREGVTCAANKLRDANLIGYRRGRITVLNRTSLQRRSCECYFVVRGEMDRLQPEHEATHSIRKVWKSPSVFASGVAAGY